VCGIAGLAGPIARDEARLRAMTSAQRHRGPDDADHWRDPTLPVALGHRRLSIIDLRPDGRQPMASPEGDLRLVFNGEIYNYLELRSELRDYAYRTRTDSEVILAAYRAWGERCVDRFIGMFAFALWDAHRGVLFCARDRLGIKPFHWCWHDGGFLFASEVKGILAAGVPARPDEKTWGTYLVHGLYDHSDRTFFEGIRSLPPGHTLTLDVGAMAALGDDLEPEEPWGGAASEDAPDAAPFPHGARLQIRPYWELPTLTSETLERSDAEAEEAFMATLVDSVRLRLRSDVPLGVNLSGGLDSASLMTVVDGLVTGTEALQTFTASFDDPRYDEADFAAAVPHRHPWTRHVERLAPADVWRLAAEMTWHQEAPFGGIATIAYHALHARTRAEGVTVLLEGQGVDELLGGYRYFAPHHHRDLLGAGDRARLKRELQADPDGRVEAAARLRGTFCGRPLDMYQDGTTHLRPAALCPDTRARAGAEPRLASPYRDHLRNALWRDLRHTKLPRVLRMNDRLSMAHSRELREPYLDHRVVELAFRLPGHQKLRNGRTKDLLRRAMRGRLPESVSGTAKRAVVTPQREWLRGALGDQVDAMLASPRFAARGWVDPAAARRELAAFRAGRGGNAFFIWQWVSVELWHRRFVDGDERPLDARD
jgi:asparagine synthase (glutamine-hydrolysing)